MAIEDDLVRESGNLEALFFSDRSAAIIEGWEVTATDAQRRALLQQAVRIEDKAFVDRLVALGVMPQTALAMALVPLVLVAWADGELDDRERAAILRAAAERGVTTDRVMHQVLEIALERFPDPKLLPVWRIYVKRLLACFSIEDQWAMRENLLSSAHEIAEAAGGFLGLTSKISEEERDLLETLERILQ